MILLQYRVMKKSSDFFQLQFLRVNKFFFSCQLSREKDILEIGAGVTMLFHFLCRHSNFFHAQWFFGRNSFVSEPISKIVVLPESLTTCQLSEKNHFRSKKVMNKIASSILTFFKIFIFQCFFTA